MSAGQFVKDVTPTAIALGGLYLAYVNLRQPAREARHHARVEILYEEMLDTLQRRLNDLMERAGLADANTLPVRASSTTPVTRARIRLYASGPVTLSWDEVHSHLATLEIEQAAGRLNITDLHRRGFEPRLAELAELMRRDLRVPDLPLRTRIRSRVISGWYVVGGGRRRAIKAARAKESEGES